MAPIFKSVAKKMKHIKFGVIYIDNKPGMKLAQSFPGVMEAGLPSVVIVKDSITARDPLKLIKGEVVSAAVLTKSIKTATKGLEKASDGFLRKAGRTEL